MDTGFLVTAFVTLFVIIDPIGLAPVFLPLTRGMSPAQRRSVGLRASLVAIGLLLVFGAFGQAILTFIGISMPAFRISGGILLFLTALDMLFERRAPRRQGQAQGGDDPSVFPLAMPLIAGPGAMTTMILLIGKAGESVGEQIMVYAVMVAVIALCYVFFLAAGPLERILGQTGTNVITRLLGMLLAALAIQFVIDGIKATSLLH
ncbi:MarC family protein [Thioclava sp. BHET1]|nr:MarC family protein [Thioclava sp. BHET1]